VKDENILIMLEEELACYSQNLGADGLTEEERNELIELANEPSEKDIATESEYLNATKRWRTK
jgi:hypothetical protein